jgi:hypothetical protein
LVGVGDFDVVGCQHASSSSTSLRLIASIQSLAVVMFC